PLEKLEKVIDWEIFRPTLNSVFEKDRSKGGRPPYDYVMMFKILLLQRLYNLSDHKTEFMILDRLSFQRFLHIEKPTTKIPDEKTLWYFRNKLSDSEKTDELFQLFESMLENRGLIKHDGTIIDASFVEVPKQRNSRKENEQLKKGEIPGGWTEAKKRQKDSDAKWTKKNNVTFFGYKNHISIDMLSKFILSYAVTSANVHDSQIYQQLLDGHHVTVYADSAYIGQTLPDHIKQEVCERAFRNKPLTEKQVENNRLKSKIRCRVEHVFGFIENSMNGSTFRGNSMARAKCNVALTNLIYNMCRFEQIIRLNLLK
ncbi:MAG: IS5 family transposase, partial [Culicoidibacterales bacterium]